VNAIKAELSGPGKIHLSDLKFGTLAKDAVRVRVEYVGVCGSDLHFFKMGQATAGTPFGHEIVGKVVEASHDDLGALVGKRVVVNPYRFCNTCYFCHLNSPANCKNRAPSFTTGFASHVDVTVTPDRSNVLLVEQSMPSQTAVLAEPMSVAVRAVKQALKAGIVAEPGSSPSLVLGAGPIGLLVIHALKTHGFDNVWVLDKSEARLDLASTAGANRAFQSMETLDAALSALPDQDAGIGGTDLLPPVRYIFECSGAVPLLAHAAHDWLGRAGVIVQVGLFGQPASVNIDSLLRKEGSLVTSYAYSAADWPVAMEILSRVTPSEIVTKFDGLDSLQETLVRLKDGEIARKPIISVN